MKNPVILRSLTDSIGSLPKINHAPRILSMAKDPSAQSLARILMDSSLRSE